MKCCSALQKVVTNVEMAFENQAVICFYAIFFDKVQRYVLWEVMHNMFFMHCKWHYYDRD